MSADQGGTAYPLATRHESIDERNTPIRRWKPAAVEILEESDPKPVSATPNALSSDLASRSYQSADPVVPADLYQRLLGFRGQLAAVWSDETIHPSYKEQTRRAVSTGQCGVSSAWILWKLGRHYRADAKAKYCYGDIIDDRSGERFEFHCWIEFGDSLSPRRMVLDLTCDQFDFFAETPVLLDRHDQLMRQSIDYSAVSRRSYWLLIFDHVWGRFTVLRMRTDPSATTVWRPAIFSRLRWRTTEPVPAE